MTLLAALAAPQLMFLAGLFVLVIILWTRAKRAFRRVTPRTPPGQLPPLPATMRAGASSGAAATLTAQHERWQVEMHEMARDVAAQVDNKVRLLQIATAQATAAAERLEAAIEAAGLQLDPADANRQRQLAQDVRAITGWDFAPLSSQTAAPSASATPLERDAQQREIYRLADQGHGARRIAQLTGLQLGEVELLLSIRSRK